MFCDCDEEGPKWFVGGGGTGGVSAAGRRKDGIAFSSKSSDGSWAGAPAPHRVPPLSRSPPPTALPSPFM